MDNNTVAQSAKDRAISIPLDEIDVSHPYLWRTDSHWAYFERLRREDPVHYCRDSLYGAYWSITKYHDIMAVDTNHQVFSSDGGIVILDEPAGMRLPMFIMLDRLNTMRSARHAWSYRR
jgi:cytochrome P450